MFLDLSHFRRYAEFNTGRVAIGFISHCHPFLEKKFSGSEVCELAPEWGQICSASPGWSSLALFILVSPWIHRGLIITPSGLRMRRITTLSFHFACYHWCRSKVYCSESLTFFQNLLWRRIRGWRSCSKSVWSNYLSLILLSVFWIESFNTATD